MSAVTLQEIVEALVKCGSSALNSGLPSTAKYLAGLADRIEQHGIAPSDNVKQADEETHRRVDEAVRDGRLVDKRAPEAKP